MGSGRGGGNEETWGRDQERGREISFGNQSQRYAACQDLQQRRAGQRFHYRRRARWRKPFTCDREDFGSSCLLLAWISLFLVTLPTLSHTAELANRFATCTPSWTTSIASSCLFFHPESSSSVSALHCRILAAAPAIFGAMCANATNFIHFWVASDQVGLRVHRSRALAKFFTSFYSIQHLQTLPTIHAQRRLRLLVTAPPITCNQSPARPHRTASSSLPASLRPAAPPACRPTCPGRLARTRPPLCHAAQRLHTSRPCHSVPNSTPGTLRKYDRKKNEKKSPIHRSDNVFQPGGGIRAQHTWHQLWTRANPAYFFLVQQPLAPHNHHLLRAGTRAASTRPLTPSHTLQHGRLQRTDGPSPRDCGLRGQSLVPPSPPFTQAAASLATPGRQLTWGSPATLLADLVGAWLGTRAQRQRDRHGTPSAPTVQFTGAPASAVSQTPGLGSGGGDDGDVRTHNFSSAISLPSPAGEQHMDTLVLAADQTPGLGSGGGDAGPARTHSTLQPPGTRRPSQPCRRDSTSAAGLYSSAREQCMDTPTLAADQTPGLGSGGGDTRPVRVHLALQPPGTRVTLTRSISTPATPSSDPALTAAHSRTLGSTLQQTLHWVATEAGPRDSNAGYCGVGSHFPPNDIAAACDGP